MIISIASGKGGTGKTTVAVNLALSLPKGTAQLIDCDVEEPNSHLFLSPTIHQVSSVGIPVPRIDESKCTYCGKCAKVCEYHAIAVILKNVLVFDELCHGCGACSYLCPEKAIFEVEREIGIVQEGNANGMSFINGVLNIGEPMASPLIRKAKEKIQKDRIVILDAPPGTACPVIETVKGSDFCLLVTEPTPFGLNDLELAVGMLEKLEIPKGVVVNKADIGDRGVWNYCKSRNIPILMEIPMDRQIAESYSKGIPIVIENPSYIQKFEYLFEKIKNPFAVSSVSPLSPPFNKVAWGDFVEKSYEPGGREGTDR
ncbi:MAG TPA: ATP-binding protein [Thermodesulfobacteriota bacterium]|nr:ATP-binding protein [Thermodesulfobacteriota bacterium]